MKRFWIFITTFSLVEWIGRHPAIAGSLMLLGIGGGAGIANLVTPVLLGRRFTLNPVVIFVSLIFWMWLWGVPGALLSVPILVSIKVVCDHFPAMSPVGKLLSR